MEEAPAAKAARSIHALTPVGKSGTTGIADFTVALGQALWKRNRIRLEPAYYSSAREFGQQLKLIRSSDPLMVQYTYAALSAVGVPSAALIHMFKRYRRSGSEANLTFFHEACLPGKQTTLKRAVIAAGQRISARIFVRLCGASAFNSRQAMRAVRAPAGSRFFTIPSSFGRLEEVDPLCKRDLVILGNPVSNSMLLASLSDRADELFLNWRPDSIVVLGGCPPSVETLSGVPVHLRGRAEASEVGAILRDALVGLTRYGSQSFHKSSVVGAYAAHGVAIATLGEWVPGGMQSASEEGLPYLTGPLPDESVLRRLSLATHTWSEVHAMERLSDYVAQWLESLEEVKSA